MTNLQKSKRALKRVKTLIKSSYDNYETSELMEDVLQEMIDTEVISVKDISAEMKLMLLLFNLGIQRAEKNKVKKKREFSEDVALS